MSQPTPAVTLNLVRLALDAAQMRHQVIANNIANANTPGFVPQRVSFESQLEAVRAALQDGRAVDPALLRGVAPRVERDPAPSAAVALDMETAALAENTVRYEALLKVLGKQMSIMSIVVNQGKR